MQVRDCRLCDDGHYWSSYIHHYGFSCESKVKSYIQDISKDKINEKETSNLGYCNVINS